MQRTSCIGIYGSMLAGVTRSVNHQIILLVIPAGLLTVSSSISVAAGILHEQCYLSMHVVFAALLLCLPLLLGLPCQPP